MTESSTNFLFCICLGGTFAFVPFQNIVYCGNFALKHSIFCNRPLLWPSGHNAIVIVQKISSFNINFSLFSRLETLLYPVLIDFRIWVFNLISFLKIRRYWFSYFILFFSFLLGMNQVKPTDAEVRKAMQPADPKSVVSIILGGGAGTRLFPLTQKRAKPAVSSI